MQVIFSEKTPFCPSSRTLLASVVAWLVLGRLATAGELGADDFSFCGPSCSQGPTVEGAGQGHSKVAVGHAPGWC